MQACSTTKKVEQTGISAKDYPYIEAFHRALRYQMKGQFDQAAKDLEFCLTLRQDDDAVYYALSKIELEREQFAASAAYIEKAAEIDPENIWYIQELAYMYYETQQFTQSALNFKKLVDAEPRNVEWLYGYAEALVQSGQSQKAIDILNRTEQEVGKHPELAIKRHYLYLDLKKLKEAEQELLNAKTQFPKEPRILATLTEFYFTQNRQKEAIEMLEALVEADPSNGRAHLTLADVYRQQGNQAKAYESLRLAFLSEDIDLDTKMKILIRILENSYTIDPEVYGLVDLVVSMHPNEAKSHSIRGDFMIRKEDEVEALISYRKALEFDQNLFPVWNQVLVMEYQQALFQDLYKDSKKCLDLYPGNPSVYLFQGISANQLRLYREAEEALLAGKELIINDNALLAEFYGQLGDAFFGLRRYDEGISHYKTALELSPESLLLKNNYAYRLAYHKKELDVAEKLITEVLGKTSNQGAYYDTYGLILFQKGRYPDAKLQFEKAFEINPNDALIMEHLGDVNYKLGNSEKSIEYWKSALNLSGNNPNLEQKIQDKKFYEFIY